MSAFDRVLLAIDLALEDTTSAFELDKLMAARQCLVETSHPTQGSSTQRWGERRMFVKWCPKCEKPKPGGLFNKNAAKRDGLQTICRACQRLVYQQHQGALAEEAT